MLNGLEDVIRGANISPGTVGTIATGIITGTGALAYQLWSGTTYHPLPGMIAASSLLGAYLALVVVRVRNESICQRIEREGFDNVVRNHSMIRYAELYAKANGKMDAYTAAVTRAYSRNASSAPCQGTEGADVEPKNATTVPADHATAVPND